ncbi:MAG TPA: GNAT family protein [Chitinophagaceae bacterium]
MDNIITPRLILRPLTPETYAEVFTTYSEEEQKLFFGCKTGEELTEERKKYEQGLQMYRKSLLMFHLIEKETEKVIGWCGYHTWYLPHNRAEIGYVLTDEASKRKGYMKEALPYVIEYGFTQMNLHRIEAMVGPDNPPSLRLLTSLGFVQEGLLREHYFINGKFDDSLVFSLLKNEYKPLPGVTTPREKVENSIG